MTLKRVPVLLLVSTLVCQASFFNNSEILHETELHPIPKEMTFEEYQDMNRRVSLGLMLSAVPIPGSIHEYAGEIKTSRRLRLLGAFGLGLVLVGVSMKNTEINDKDFEGFSTLSVGNSDYYQVPVSSTAVTVDGVTTTSVEYKLKRIEKEYRGNALVVLIGAGLLIANYAYDYYYGIRVIERKRDMVRFKYGKSIDLGFKPIYNPINNSGSFTLFCDF